MVVEFDPATAAANRLKHGVPLAFGLRVLEDVEHVVPPAIRPIDGEDRYKAVGLVEGRLWTVLYVGRGAAVRLISVRRSNAGIGLLNGSPARSPSVTRGLNRQPSRPIL